MINGLNEYKKKYDIAIKAVENLLFKVKEKIINLEQSEESDLAEIDYDSIVYNLENQIDELKKQKYRYRFDKMDEAEFDLMLKNLAEGKPVRLIIIGREYTVRQIDTLQSISQKFSVTIEELLAFNKIDIDTFDDYVDRGVTIKIPIQVTLKNNPVYQNIPVFGSQSGTKAWGVDWPNEIVYDAATKDIKLLSNEDTLLQAVANRFGDYGTVPGYEDQSIDLPYGEDEPTDLIDGLMVIQISEKMLMETRVAEVKDVVVSEAADNPTGRNVKLYLSPVNAVPGEKPFEVSIPTA